MTRNLRLALCQATSDLGREDFDPRPPNIERAIGMMRRAKKEGAQLALFGEVYLEGYRTDWFFHKYSTKLDPPDDCIRELIAACKDLDLYVAMGICRRGKVMPGNLFNTAMLLGPDGVVGWYDKVHLGNFPLPDGRLATEAIYWDVGHEYRVFDLPWCRVGLQICRDVRYPEASRTLTLMGAELVINLSAAVEVRHDSWEYFTRTRANENQVWFAMTSVVGPQEGFQLFGGSRIVSPTGEVVVRAKDNVEDLVVKEIDLDEVARVRSLSHVLDRRQPRAYKIITAEE
jgi:predicted amidohydrolase